MGQEPWAAGVDLGGTKIQIIQVTKSGTLGEKIRCPTDVSGGASAVEKEIANAVRELQKRVGSPPQAIGVGIAGQIEPKSGFVSFAPNLKWKDVPFQQNLVDNLKIPVVVTNDVRAATWGEWLHGAGQGCNDLLCLFIGTGVGGGIVANGAIVAGDTNSAGEVGHMVVQMDGPLCSCGQRGCVEAFAGGWALTRAGQELAKKDPRAGAALLKLAGGDSSAITGKEVSQAYREGDPHAAAIIGKAIEALIAATSSLANTLNPRRIIFGGGVVEGLPELISKVGEGVKKQALKTATQRLELLPAKLRNDAGAIGAGALALRTFAN